MPTEPFAIFSTDNCNDFSFKSFIIFFCAVTELQKFGANIQVSGSRATVYGKGKARYVYSSCLISSCSIQTISRIDVVMNFLLVHSAVLRSMQMICMGEYH